MLCLFHTVCKSNLYIVRTEVYTKTKLLHKGEGGECYSTVCIKSIFQNIWKGDLEIAQRQSLFVQ